MKKTFYIFLISIISILDMKAQIGIINDPDGFTNVRSGPGIEYPIIGKIEEHEPFWIVFENAKNSPEWQRIMFFVPSGIKEGTEVSRKNRERRDGYMHASRIKIMEENTRLEKSVQGHKVKFTHDSIELIVHIGSFDEQAHTILKNENGQVLRVDNVFGYGLEDVVPRMEIKSMEIIISGRTYEIPKVHYNYLFEPNLQLMQVYVDDQNRLFVSMSNADGGIAYRAVMVFKNGEYLNGMAGSPY